MPENISVNSKIVIDDREYIVVSIVNRPEAIGYVLEYDIFNTLSLLVYQDEQWVTEVIGRLAQIKFEKVEDGVFFFTVFEDE